MGLVVLILGLVVFLATHVFVSFRGARADAIAKLGINGYRAVFCDRLASSGLPSSSGVTANIARMAGCRSGRRRRSCATSPSA